MLRLLRQGTYAFSSPETLAASVSSDWRANRGQLKQKEIACQVSHVLALLPMQRGFGGLGRHGKAAPSESLPGEYQSFPIS